MRNVRVSEKLAKVEVGEHDVVSRAAHFAHVTLCSIKAPERPHLLCTRAAGHHEAMSELRGAQADHPCTQHVAAGVDFIALAVWS